MSESQYAFLISQLFVVGGIVSIDGWRMGICLAFAGVWFVVFWILSNNKH